MSATERSAGALGLRSHADRGGRHDVCDYAFDRLVALDAETGRELWSYDPKLDRQQPYTLFIHRGASYWTDGKRRRIVYGTLDSRLISVDAPRGGPMLHLVRTGRWTSARASRSNGPKRG